MMSAGATVRPVSVEGKEPFNLKNLAAEMHFGVAIADRQYFFKTYKNCFVGSEAVAWLVSSGHATDIAEALVVGNLMLKENIFFHVTRDHVFKNEKLFYRFLADESHGQTERDSLGAPVSLWKDYAKKALGSVRESFTGVDSLVPGLAQVDRPADDVCHSQIISDIPPKDSYNVQLLDNVHPSPWRDPEPDDKGDYFYNLLVIGGGAAGLVSAIGSQSLGAKVALIEGQFLGGDCTNFGCVPSKALIKSAKVAKTVQECGEFGIEFDEDNPPRVNFPKVMERMRRIRADISEFEAADRLSGLGIDVFIGRAEFDSNHSVLCNGKRLTFRKCILCTGGTALVPPIPGLADVPYMTNESFYNQTILPERLIVVGTGPIGCEMAQSMARFGSRVTMFTRTNRVLEKEDADAALLVKESLLKDGVEVLACTIEKVGLSQTKTSSGDRVWMDVHVKLLENSERRVLVVDGLLIATGRFPRVTNMGLDIAQVQYSESKGIEVDDFMRTSNSNIFAAGDCCSRYQFTHMADAMARIAIKNALFFGSEKFSELIVPWATYTEPEISHVGLYATDLDKKSIPYVSYVKEFVHNDRAKCESSTEGFIKIHAHKSNGSILGCTIVGEGAGDIISEITMAMVTGAKMDILSSVIHPYPTRAEVVHAIGDDYTFATMSVTVRQILRSIIYLSSGKKML